MTLRSANKSIAVAFAAAVLNAQVLTWHNDNARTGQNLDETALRPDNVNPKDFGKLFVIPVDGKVDAQPLYVPALAIAGGFHNVLYVETEHDSAYAFDADNGAVLWHVSLLAAGESTSDNRNCGQVDPEIGITATPVIDPQSAPHGAIYMAAMSKDSSGNYHQRLHALDLATGAEQFGGPIEVQATYPGTGAASNAGTMTFDPKQYKERAALVLVNGVIYTSWASHCDIAPYTAWVIGYDEKTLARTSVLNLTPNGSDGSIWASGAGPAVDANGSLYFLMANGTFDTTLNSGGFPTKGDYGNAFMKLSTAGNSLAVADYFAMSNTVAESNVDEDLGSGGAIVLPPFTNGQGATINLAVGAGKDASVYVVDTQNMGKFSPGQNRVYQEIKGAVGQVFSSPAWFNGVLYYAGVGDQLKAFPLINGSFTPVPSSQSAQAFPYPGATPSISANGSSNGIAWVAENGNPAVLHAYDAADLGKELYNSNMAANGRDQFGTGNKYIVPTVANGKVYVGTTNGVGVFGLFRSAIGPRRRRPEMIWQNEATRQVVVWYMSGATRTGWDWLYTGSGSAGWHVIAALDFNGDDQPDLVWPDDTTHQIVVSYYGGSNGNTYLGWNWLYATSVPGWHLRAVADFNGDGQPDLVWQNDTTRQVVVDYYNGLGGAAMVSWAWLYTGTGGVGWHVVAAADFNGDSVPDLVWQNDTTRQVVVDYYGGPGGSTVVGWAWLYPGPGAVGWHVGATTDLNGDGVPDLIWQNDAAGQVTVHYYGGPGGATDQGWDWLYAMASDGWSVVN